MYFSTVACLPMLGSSYSRILATKVVQSSLKKLPRMVNSSGADVDDRVSSFAWRAFNLS